MSGVELCFDSGVDINCEEEQIERTVQVDVGLVLSFAIFSREDVWVG